jgi:large conductance mechanosensitive channel
LDRILVCFRFSPEFRNTLLVMLKGFKEFITRGNIVELAVAFVIGTAFAAVVNQLTKSFLDPLIRVIFGGGVKGGTFVVRGQIFDYGAFINQVITFLVTAAAIYYLVVVPMNMVIERRRARGIEPTPEEMSDEVRLLTEIRDELARGRAGR